MKIRRKNFGDVRDRTDFVTRDGSTRRTFGINNSANNFGNANDIANASNFANDLSDRLDRTRAVISWLENNAPRIAAGWRLVMSLVRVWDTVGNVHLRFA